MSTAAVEVHGPRFSGCQVSGFMVPGFKNSGKLFES